MQHPEAFTSLATFTRFLADTMRQALPPDAGAATLPDDLPSLFQYLGQVNTWCADHGTRLLLGLDEYEHIDAKIGAGIFPRDLLATVRESIQSHRALTWLFAGSHPITALTAAPWTSYLVSARTLDVPAFTLAETRLLLTEPLQHSTLWDTDAPTRPHFAPAFWGLDGIERLHQEAAGWPHLVQLLAETTVDLLNEAEQPAVDAALLEQALRKAVERGQNVLYELMHAESTLPGEWAYLAGFRRQATQPPPADEAVYTSLRQRLLVEEADATGAWQLRVPLLARWLRYYG